MANTKSHNSSMNKLKLICISIIALSFGCNKESGMEQKRPFDAAYEAKLFKYIERTIGVPRENIEYTPMYDSLILYRNYKIGVKTIANEYDNANVYKEKYEKE